MSDKRKYDLHLLTENAYILLWDSNLIHGVPHLDFYGLYLNLIVFFLELYFSSEEEIGSTRRSSVSSEQLHERAKMVKRVLINIIISPKLIIFLISRIKTVRRCCIHNLFYVILLFFSWNVMHFFGMCNETKINFFC